MSRQPRHCSCQEQGVCRRPGKDSFCLRSLPPGRNAGTERARDTPVAHSRELFGEHSRRGAPEERARRFGQLRLLPYASLYSSPHRSAVIDCACEHCDDVYGLPYADRRGPSQGHQRRVVGKAGAYSPRMRGLSSASQGTQGLLRPGNGRQGLSPMPRAGLNQGFR